MLWKKIPDPTTVIATAVTAASVVFTTWSVYDLATPTVPALVALAVGAGVELVWLFVLATEWKRANLTGDHSRGLTATGWILATLAAVVIAVHGVLASPALAILAVLPLAAKAGWHWQTRQRAEETRARIEAEQAEADRAEAERAEAEAERVRVEAERAERELALSVDPTDEDEREIAKLRRQANVAKLRAAAETDLTTAQAEADRLRQEADAEAERIRRQSESRMRREAIQNKTEEELAALEANARLFKRRQEVEVEMALTRPYALTSGTTPRVPDDASALQPGGGGTPGSWVASGAGFGGAMAHAGTAPAHVGGHVRGSDQQMPQVPGQVPGAVVHHSSAEAEVNRARVAEVFEVLHQATGEAPSIAAVARGAGVSDRAAGRHLRAAGLID
ncbi:hypothetical protein [Nocardiopsis sp. L17-MgMaSL7]|uniref:hypothetical protein n=1 Tax=Nocardiopsis sp. L17-MgMaSL7 TaxID=1938893 RepID=UPI000D70B376|nr:hypothetical protein [Nocardiopsis sp. L17-MgMaSL7]PWV44557.1 hypothetical protein BDW27_12316 [Nocardiopsis sp. L17-MgMaSL7]